MKHDAVPLCQHCGTPVPSLALDARFCCAGCAYVHELLVTEGLGKFYELRGGTALPPVAPDALRARDDEWLQEQVAAAEAAAGPGGTAHLDLAVQGLTCVGCVWLMEKVFHSEPGAMHLDVHVARGEAHLEWQAGGWDLPAYARRLQRFGYLVGPAGERGNTSVQSAGFGRRVGLCGAFAMNAMAFSLPGYLGMGKDFIFASWFDIVAACSATLSVLVGGSYFMERSVNSLRQGILHMDTPIALGILLAWLGSLAGWLAGVAGLKYFDFVGVFVFLMLAGRWLQQGMVERNRRRLLAASAVPGWVRVVGPEGQEKRMGLDEVAVGDLLRIPSGSICPVGGVLTSSEASLSLEWINGESAAVARSAGQAVPSGAVNIGLGLVEVRAAEVWKESLLCRLNAATGQEGSRAISSRFLAGYLMVVLALGVIGAAVWWFSGHGMVTALQVMISVFVVSCPCALGVAVPFADDLAASRMARLGVFVRAGSLWTRLLQVRKVVFDKTGTLTMENPVLANPAEVTGMTPEARTALRKIVSSNLHPVSRSLFDALGPDAAFDDAAGVEGIEEIAGQGLRWTGPDGRVWALGRPGWVEVGSCAGKPVKPSDAWFTCDGRWLAGFRFTDSLRPESVEACEALRERGCKLYLLSGDREAKVAAVAGQLHMPVTHWQAEMTPEGKAARVRQMNHGDTLFIGDGANDVLALEAALCAGSPVTGRNFLEHRADFYFLGNCLRFMPELLQMAVVRSRAVRRVLGFALAYNAVAVALSLAGWMSPLLAAVLMPLSSLVTLGLVGATFRGRSRAFVSNQTQERREMEQTMRRGTGPVPIS